MRYFLDIMGILGFCYFMIFSKSLQYFDTLILYFVFLRIVEIFFHPWI